MPKETYVPCLLKLFRQYGYDGTTLAKISEATGLGKASLYHHFPGGKDEMVRTVLEFLDSGVHDTILPILHGDTDALTRLREMCDRLNERYQGGEQPCVFAILLMGSARDVFHAKVQELLQSLMLAIANVLIDAGMDEDLAIQRAQDGAIAIQGSLILSQALDDPSIFQRVIQQLPEKLCASLPVK